MMLHLDLIMSPRPRIVITTWPAVHRRHALYYQARIAIYSYPYPKICWQMLLLLAEPPSKCEGMC
jgi:hypothetical protein